MAKKAKQAPAPAFISDDRLEEVLELGIKLFGAPSMQYGASESRSWNLLQWGQQIVEQELVDRMYEGADCDENRLFDTCGPITDLFWQLMYREWIGFDAIPHLEFAELLCTLRDVRPVDLMPSEMRTLYDGLPDEVAVYRGGDMTTALRGLSWTLDHDVAEAFAHGHRWRSGSPNPVIISGRVKKSDIAFATNERGEREIVMFSPRDVRSKEVMRVLEVRQHAA